MWLCDYFPKFLNHNVSKPQRFKVSQLQISEVPKSYAVFCSKFRNRKCSLSPPKFQVSSPLQKTSNFSLPLKVWKWSPRTPNLQISHLPPKPSRAIRMDVEGLMVWLWAMSNLAQGNTTKNMTTRRWTLAIFDKLCKRICTLDVVAISFDIIWQSQTENAFWHQKWPKIDPGKQKKRKKKAPRMRTFLERPKKPGIPPWRRTCGRSEGAPRSHSRAKSAPRNTQDIKNYTK